VAPWPRYLIAFVVGRHGFTYIPFGTLVPDKLEEWKGTSWCPGGAITGDRLKVLVRMLHVVPGITILAAAVAIALASPAPWFWRPLAIAGAAVGIAAFAAFYDGQARLLAQVGPVGAVASLVLLAPGIAFPGVFG
jgi:hypothetical protein